MSGQTPTVAERLAGRLALPVGVADRERACRHVLDWATCAVGGVVEPGTAELRRLAVREGAGPCRVVGGARAGPQAAALANGAAGAILEMDDVDRRALLHPGPVVIPAALAAADASGRLDGSAFLDAVVRGYEAAIRVGRAAGPGHYAHFHPTGACGGFGAAAAAASVLGLGETATTWAFGNAGQVAGGLWRARHEPVFSKAMHDGRAAANGLAAAFLAADGYAGPLGVFEGAQGFFEGLCPGAHAEDVTANLDAGWLIHEVSFKPHAACRHAHPTIDATLELLGLSAGREPRTIEVFTYANAVIFCNRPDPGTPALRARTRVREEPALTTRYPTHFGARVCVVFTDGLSETALAADAWGDPERPLDDAGLLAKARALCAWGGLDAHATERLIEATWALGKGGDVAAFSSALPGADA